MRNRDHEIGMDESGIECDRFTGKTGTQKSHAAGIVRLMNHKLTTLAPGSVQFRSELSFVFRIDAFGQKDHDVFCRQTELQQSPDYGGGNPFAIADFGFNNQANLVVRQNGQIECRIIEGFSKGFGYALLNVEFRFFPMTVTTGQFRPRNLFDNFGNLNWYHKLMIPVTEEFHKRHRVSLIARTPC